MKNEEHTRAVPDSLQRAFQHLARGELQQAEALYREILAENPDSRDALYALGDIALQTGKVEEALQLLGKAIVADGSLFSYHCRLGDTLSEQGDLEGAVASYKRAISLRPAEPAAITNLGNTLRDRGDLDEAVACYQQVLSLRPEDHVAHANLGVALADLGKLDEATACFKHALSLKPDYDQAHFDLSIIYLLRGDLKAGWVEYDYRMRLQSGDGFFHPDRFKLSQPFWDGSVSKGKTILLSSEQGRGDIIQFIRYVPMVLDRCDGIVVECRPELHELLRGVAGIHKIVAHNDPLPDFDLHCPLVTLPLIFDTTLDTIPSAVPYITNNHEKVLKWGRRLRSRTGMLKIGLCWAGNPKHRYDKNRSVPLAMFSPLAAVQGVTFYSLQKGAPAEQVKKPTDGPGLLDYTHDLHDFSDTAALIENLDLVISVDTAVAHLAGALGKPVWVLLPFLPDWRWMLDRTDSPWYPTMRLFRSASRRDWGGAITSLKEALDDFVYRKAHA